METPSLIPSRSSVPAADMHLPHDIKLHIAREVYNDKALPDSLENIHNLISLSMSSKSWRFASLPYLYSHCGIGGRGNFAIENWLVRILPQYGQFTRSIDVALCWIHSNYLPERERESMELDQSGTTSPWESARDALVAQLVAGLPKLSTVKLTMLMCTIPRELNECSCLNRFKSTVQAFEDGRFRSMTLHGLATAFCPRLAQAVFMPSANMLQSIEFGDDLDGYPSLAQPFEQICQLPVLTHATFAAGSFHEVNIESLPWICPLETVLISNQTMDYVRQPLSIEQMSIFVQNFSSSLRSLALEDVVIDSQVGTGNQALPDLPYLATFSLRSTRNSTFRALELLEAHTFESLSITISPAVEPALLLNALSKGAFPELMTIEIRFNPRDNWSTSSRWYSNARAAVQKICDTRFIKLTMSEHKRQKARI
ncbi:unnamed protein product [Rhizoctonia solani]|uniref:Uncharacterized protein n=1 Tax=Rhizoctonia solani TaxID=456999 RepID=A0A8H2WE80_9AGAM|nr:unnamed protein product [Rhizoctonia solani]